MRNPTKKKKHTVKRQKEKFIFVVTCDCVTSIDQLHIKSSHHSLRFDVFLSFYFVAPCINIYIHNIYVFISCIFLNNIVNSCVYVGIRVFYLSRKLKGASHTRKLTVRVTMLRSFRLERCFVRHAGNGYRSSGTISPRPTMHVFHVSFISFLVFFSFYSTLIHSQSTKKKKRDITFIFCHTVENIIFITWKEINKN